MKNLFNSKKIRCGFNATLITVLFVIVVLLLNMLVGVVCDKFPNLNIDLTANKQFEITDATKTALGEVDGEVSLKLLMPDSNGEPVIEELLSRYKQIKSNINIERINIEKNPAIVQEYGNIDTTGTLVIENKDKHEAVSFGSLYGKNGDLADAESLITNGIISVTTGEKKTILFSEGHGEYPAYGIAAVAQKNYYNYDVLDITKNKIENCDMLIIFCPTVDFTSSEIAAIESYVLTGGNIQVYLTPQTAYLPNLCEYIREWGIDVRNEIIAEKNKDNITQQNDFIPVVSNNEYTKNVSKTLYYKYAYKLDNLYSETKGITLHPVLSSTNKATVLSGEGDTGNIGTHIISMVSERVLDDNSVVKMYVSGSSLRHEDESYMYNDEVCQSVLTGILPSESYVDVPSKSSEAAQLLMTTTDFVFIIIVVILIALAILAYGIIVWSKRRNL